MAVLDGDMGNGWNAAWNLREVVLRLRGVVIFGGADEDVGGLGPLGAGALNAGGTIVAPTLVARFRRPDEPGRGSTRRRSTSGSPRPTIRMPRRPVLHRVTWRAATLACPHASDRE